MTALSDALTAAQRSALAALEKAYVAGAIESEAMVAALESAGISDPVDTAFLLSALDVLKEWGVSAPTMGERVARENGEPEKASDKQRHLILDLCVFGPFGGWNEARDYASKLRPEREPVCVVMRDPSIWPEPEKAL